MRILLIAPERPGITNDPELRDIADKHTVLPYTGTVTTRELYQVCQQNRFDIIHIIDHNEPGTDRDNSSVIPLSGGDKLTGLDIVNMAKAAGTWSNDPDEGRAAGLFLNTCNSSFYATYATRRGIPWAVYTTLDIYDKAAWKAPWAFYNALHEMEDADGVDLYRAYLSIGDSGLYGWAASHNEYRTLLLSPILEKLEHIDTCLDDLRETLKSIDKRGTRGTKEKIVEFRHDDYVRAIVIASLFLPGALGGYLYLYWMLVQSGARW